MKNHDLEIIKRYYGERMMKICRDNLYKVLDVPGLLPKLIDDNFARYSNLAEDIIEQEKTQEFVSFMLSKAGHLIKDQHQLSYSDKSAPELMKEAGYILYPECKNEADIQSFRHFYHRDDGKVIIYDPKKRIETHNGDELCTFNGGRLSTARVWFAVRPDAEKYKRENYQNPQRQDAYSTSVLSIQFSKNEYSTLSIKSRYNDNAFNGDNTFGSNLDNIIPGLTYSFEKTFGVKDKRAACEPTMELDGYVQADDGKFYPYNQKINGIYYCPNNIIIENNKVKKLPNHQLLVEKFIVDFNNHTISLYDNSLHDAFVDEYGMNKKIVAEKNHIKITKSDGTVATLRLNKKREIVALKDENLKKCGHDFLKHNTSMEEIFLPQVEECGDEFLRDNKCLKVVKFPHLKRCGNDFLVNNKIINEIDLRELEECGWDFLSNNRLLEELYFPKLKKVGSSFLFRNKIIKRIYMPELRKCGNSFLFNNNAVEYLYFPFWESCGDGFLGMNKSLKTLYAPSLKNCGNGFVGYGGQLKRIDLPSLKECGQGFIFYQNNIKEVNLPNVEKMGIMFFYWKPTMTEVKVSKAVYNRWRDNGNSPMKIKLTTFNNKFHCMVSALKNNMQKTSV